MGKGKGGGGGGGTGGNQAGNVIILRRNRNPRRFRFHHVIPRAGRFTLFGLGFSKKVAEENQKVEMTVKVLLEVRDQTKEEKRVAIRSKDGSVTSFNPFPGQHPQTVAFRKR